MGRDSIEQIERDIEKTRSEFSETVVELKSQISSSAEELRRRVSPASLKSEAKHYVERTTQDVLLNLKQSAAERPLEAIAVGGCLAYVGWKILHKIPAPFLLLGAGVALLRSSPGDGNPSNGPNEEFSAKAAAAVEKVNSAVSGGASTVAAAVGNIGSDAANAARRMASSATAAASHTATSIYQEGANAASRVANYATEAGRQSGANVANALDRHPMVVGGVGLAIGAIIAASLPKTSAENRFLGEMSDDLKDQASKIGREGYEAAKNAGHRIYDRSFARDRKGTVDEASDGAPPGQGGSAAESEADNGRSTI